MNRINGYRRARSDAAERARWAERFHQSGLSQRDFALRHGLGLSTLQRWLSQQAAGGQRSGPAFRELKLPPVAARWAAEVTVPDGRVVRLAHDVPLTLLQELLPPC